MSNTYFRLCSQVYCKMGDEERTYSQGIEQETESTEAFSKDITEKLDAKWKKSLTSLQPWSQD